MIGEFALRKVLKPLGSDLEAGIRMRSGMRMRTHRMREILVNADKDANASDRI